MIFKNFFKHSKEWYLFIVCYVLINVSSAASAMCSHCLGVDCHRRGENFMMEMYFCHLNMLKPNCRITVCDFPFSFFFSTLFCAWISIAHTSHIWNDVGFMSPTLLIQRLWSFLLNLIFHLNEFIIESLVTMDSSAYQRSHIFFPLVTRSNSIKLN